MSLYSSQFQYFGKNSKIVNPLQIKNARNIFIGQNVTINDQAFIMVESKKDYKNSILTISDGCTIGNFNHIVALNKVIIERDVLTADHVYISDNFHDYSNISISINKQPILSKGSTIIGEGSWIGEHVSIISAKIGKHCVVAANSVVNKDFPDNCIIAGAPAKIVKIYDSENNKWIKYECTDNNA